MTPSEPRACEDAEWMHALRNAVNAVSMSVALSTRLLREGEGARALEALERADLGLQRAAALMRRDTGDARIGDDTHAH